MRESTPIRNHTFPMLIKPRPDRWTKMSQLGKMATDDILLPSVNQQRIPVKERAPYNAPRNNPMPGVYRSRLPNGRFTNLMQVMFTDFCKMDCHFCPNSHWVPRKRFAFKVDELAKTFIELAERHTVQGLFLSSGVAGTGTKTTERMVKVVDLIRNKYHFNGYIHLKVMPGTERHIVEAAHRLGSRLSVNLETTTVEHMSKLSKMKHYERDILAPMAWIDEINRNPTHDSTKGEVGQATQFVVGAADETDLDILNRISQLYADWALKRVYYAPFRPVRYTPLEEHPATPIQRTNRLYQLDWLKRVYGYNDTEIKLALDQGGFLPLELDPKQTIALENLDAFPVDINVATRDQLMRTPGLGPISVQRIIQNRRRSRISRWQDLALMGVVRKRAWPFITFPGHKPKPAKQLRLDTLLNQERKSRTDGGTEHLIRNRAEVTREANASILSDRGEPFEPQSTLTPTPCGIRSNCDGCSLYNTPGHPGSTKGSVKYTPSHSFA